MNKLRTGILAVLLIQPIASANQATVFPIPKHAESSIYTLEYSEQEKNLSGLTVVRMYFIARLKRISNIVAKIAQNNQIKNVLSILASEDKHALTLTHPLLKKNLAEAHKKQSLMPLVAIWDSITHYQHINDFLLIHEYTKVCILVVKNSIAQTLGSHARNLAEDVVTFCDLILQLPFKAMLEAIDIVTNPYLLHHEKQIASTHQYSCLETQITSPQRFYDSSHMPLQPHAILQRFYCTQRLSKSVEFLQSFKAWKKKIIFVAEQRDESTTLLVNGTVAVNHELIVDCVEQIDKTNSLQPLFYLWEAIQEYKLIDDKGFINEFVMLMISIYKNILVEAATHSTTSTLTLEEVLKLYDQIAKLPVPKLLDVLDEYAEHCSSLLGYLDIDTKKVHGTIRFVQKYWQQIAPIFVACAAGLYYWILWHKDAGVPAPKAG